MGSEISCGGGGGLRRAHRHHRRRLGRGGAAARDELEGCEVRERGGEAAHGR